MNAELRDKLNEHIKAITSNTVDIDDIPDSAEWDYVVHSIETSIGNGLSVEQAIIAQNITSRDIDWMILMD